MPPRPASGTGPAWAPGSPPRCWSPPATTPARLRTEAGFAAPCGASPVDASSGKQRRHRLNHVGGRQANSALWRIVFTRMATDPRTQAYVARRTSEGKTTRKTIRCLKRHVAREVYKTLTGPRPGARPAPATARNSVIT